jgi:hypothetical protein
MIIGIGSKAASKISDKEVISRAVQTAFIRAGVGLIRPGILMMSLLKLSLLGSEKYLNQGRYI